MAMQKVYLTFREMLQLGKIAQTEKAFSQRGSNLPPTSKDLT